MPALDTDPDPARREIADALKGLIMSAALACQLFRRRALALPACLGVALLFCMLLDRALIEPIAAEAADASEPPATRARARGALETACLFHARCVEVAEAAAADRSAPAEERDAAAAVAARLEHR